MRSRAVSRSRALSLVRALDYGDDASFTTLSLSLCTQAAQHLTRLRDEGNLKYVAACNFDLPHLKALVEAGVPIVSNQVQ
jgi:diketogulonate reductase-like aldo/keto reductase